MAAPERGHSGRKADCAARPCFGAANSDVGVHGSPGQNPAMTDMGKGREEGWAAGAPDKPVQPVSTPIGAEVASSWRRKRRVHAATISSNAKSAKQAMTTLRPVRSGAPQSETKKAA